MQSTVQYSLSGGLSDEQMCTLTEHATQVLWEVGMEVGSQRVRDFLNDKPGFTVSGSRVRMAPELIAECIAHSRSRPRVMQNQDWNVEILSGYPTSFVDWKDGQMKPVDSERLIGMTKLVDMLSPLVSGAAPGVLQDVPPALRGIETFMCGARYCRSGGGVPLTTVEEATWIQRLYEASGKQLGLGVYVVNPLRMEGDTVDQMMELRGLDYAVGVGNMPMMGVSAPITIAGAFVMGLAAIWGGYAIVREITGARSIGVECRVWPINMRNMDIVYGTPEMLHSDLINRQLHAYYGWGNSNCDAFHSSALFPDAQANAQRAAYALAMAQAGCRVFRFGGLLGVDMVFSPEQLLYDLGILDYVQFAVQGVEFTSDALSLDAIRNVGPSGDFIGQSGTVQRCRTERFHTPGWIAESLGSWQHNHTPLWQEDVRHRIDQLIAAHEYYIDLTLERELIKIVAAAKEALR